jgi:hypothetical protein
MIFSKKMISRVQSEDVAGSDAGNPLVALRVDLTDIPVVPVVK